MEQVTKIAFTDLEGNILFEFQKHEYPESIPLTIKVKLNEIEYPDDHYTNQIIGVKPQDINFSGTFHGTYLIGGEIKTAKDRADQLKALLKRVVRVVFAINGEVGGEAQTVIIEEYKRDIVNYYEVNYTLTLKPHEPQERNKPAKVSLVSISNDMNPMGIVNNIMKTGKTVATKLENSTKPATNTPKPASVGAKPIVTTPKGITVQNAGTFAKEVGKNIEKAFGGK